MAHIALLSAAFALSAPKIQDIVIRVLDDRRRARVDGTDAGNASIWDVLLGARSREAPASTPLSPPRSAVTKLTRKSIGSPLSTTSKRTMLETEIVLCSACHQGVGTPSSPVTPLSVPASTPGSNTVNSHSGFRGVPAPKPDPYAPKPRDRYLKWDDYFMSVAFLSAQRSKDPNKQVGAVIVGPDKVIMGVGYNGFPRGCSDSDLPWAKKSTNDDAMETKYAYVCHAEMNAIMNKNSQSLHGATVYVTMYPCNECAKLIIQSGIKEVVYFEGKLAMARGGVRTAAKQETPEPRAKTWGDWAHGDLEARTGKGWDEDADETSDWKPALADRLGDGDTSLDASMDIDTPVGKGELADLRPISKSPWQYDEYGAGNPRAMDDPHPHDPTPAKSTPTKGGMQNDPTYAAAEKLFGLAGVKIRQHTPAAVIDVTYH